MQINNGIVNGILRIFGKLKAKDIEADSITGPLEGTASNASKLNDKDPSYYLDYDHLEHTPTIPSVGNGTVIINQSGEPKGTFTLNQSGDTTINLTDNNNIYSNATTSDDGLMSAGDKEKLDGIAEGAQVNIQSDWNATSGDAFILNKPSSFTPSSHTHGNIANEGTISGTLVAPANGDSILIADSSASNKLEKSIAIGTNTTKYLRNDGTWVVPPNTWRGIQDNLASDSTSDSLSAKQGKKLKELIQQKVENIHDGTGLASLMQSEATLTQILNDSQIRQLQVDKLQTDWDTGSDYKTRLQGMGITNKSQITLQAKLTSTQVTYVNNRSNFSELGTWNLNCTTNDYLTTPFIIAGFVHFGVASEEGFKNSAEAVASTALGIGSCADAPAAYAEGVRSVASALGAHAEGGKTIASGRYSHAEGTQTTASGLYSHAEGAMTQATKDYTHAEGALARATGDAAHAEGFNTAASGNYAHTEGSGTVANGDAAHAEGMQTTAGIYSHAEGYQTNANNTSHAEGVSTTARQYGSHAEGVNTIAGGEADGVGQASHAEGYGTQAIGNYSHAEGQNSQATGDYSHAEGASVLVGAGQFPRAATASGRASHAEGGGTLASGHQSHAEGNGSEASGQTSHAEGFQTEATGIASHAEGFQTQAIGNYSHTEGFQTQAIGNYSHTEGQNTKAKSTADHAEGIETTAEIGSHAEGNGTTAKYTSHAEGVDTIAQQYGSHAEGINTIAGSADPSGAGQVSHAEGYGTKAIGNYSHAEGWDTEANGLNSHAEGYRTIASGNYSHAQGWAVKATGSAQFAFGRYNKTDDALVEIVGGGTSDTNRKNIRTLDISGNETLAGNLTVNGNIYSFNPFQMPWAVADASVGSVIEASSGDWYLKLNKPGLYLIRWSRANVSVIQPTDGNITWDGSLIAKVYNTYGVISSSMEFTYDISREALRLNGAPGSGGEVYQLISFDLA